MQTFERFLGKCSLIPGGLNCIHKLLNYIQVYTEQKQMKCPMISTVAAFFACSFTEIVDRHMVNIKNVKYYRNCNVYMCLLTMVFQYLAQ